MLPLVKIKIKVRRIPRVITSAAKDLEEYHHRDCRHCSRLHHPTKMTKEEEKDRIGEDQLLGLDLLSEQDVSTSNGLRV
jgi:hypothetical protein